MLVSFLFSIMTYGQSGSVSGTVVDASTQQPLMGTTVIVRGTNTGAVTDAAGQYRLPDIEPGTYVLDVFFMGYETDSREVVITQGANLTENFSLRESSSIMDEIVISANRRPQKVTRAPATVNIITAEEIERYAGNPAELAA